MKQNKMWRTTLAAVAFAALALTGARAEAAYQIGEGDTFLKIGGLLQPQISLAKDAAPSGENWDTEFYLRRVRLMAFGQLNKYVNFFIDTDSPNFGKNGDLAVNMFIQDAFVEFNLHPAIQIDMGMIIVPFTHMTYQSAGSLLAIDYHPLGNGIAAYPDGSTKVWRDFGVMVRGMPVGKWLEYRLGIFNGLRGKTDDIKTLGVNEANHINPNDLPRFTLRLVGNIFDAEGGPGTAGFFADGLYIEKKDEGIVSQKRVLSIGAAIDIQPDAVVSEEGDTRSFSPYWAVGGDVFLDMPVDAAKLMAITGQVNFYYYSYGDKSQQGVKITSPGTTGMGITSELGFRWNWLEPVIIFDWFNPTANPDDNAATTAVNEANTGKYLGIYGGLNFWVFAQAFNIKAQFGAANKNDTEFMPSALLQAQLLF